MIIVLDASAALDVILRHGRHTVFQRELDRAEWIIAPFLFVGEVGNALWKYGNFESWPLDFCFRAYQMAIELPDEYVADNTLHREALDLACQLKHPIYDCFYLVLARRNHGMLLSGDKQLMRLARQQSISVV